MSAVFGPAGQCEASREEGIKTTEKFLHYLQERNIHAFEYQCGRGVNISEEKARSFAPLSKELGISISLHAPYYTSLASMEEQKRFNSVDYILDSARAVDWMGGDRVVVHPGGLGKFSREEATEIAEKTLLLARKALVENGLSHIHICMETMGKINQLGNLEEVLAMCRLDESIYPCIDFGHMNSRLHGGMNRKEAYADLLDCVKNTLGEERMKKMHIHFSKIKYSAGGEVNHLTFEDREYGPDFEPLMQLLAERDMSPVVICESAGTQTADALAMQYEYEKQMALI